MNTIDKMYDNYTSGEKKVDELHHRIAVQLNIPDSEMGCPTKPSIRLSTDY